MMRNEVASSSTVRLLQKPGRSRASSFSNQGSSSDCPSSLSDKFALSPDPASWGNASLLVTTPEPDDYLHNPDPRRDRKYDRGGHIFTCRGIANLGCLFFLLTGMLMLFAGYPILSHFLTKKQTNQGGFNLGGTNATGQVATMPGNFALIDLDTPQEAYQKSSYMQPGDMWDLVFSDEFNVDGRTFYPGDDPFWEAADLHYWQTNDLEWYDPQQATTANGSLRLTLTQAEPINNHNMSYMSGMIQSWNKFCFTGGLIEVSVVLPGSNSVSGLWPATWTMGNLGRAGYGASLEGMWPYSYDACDVGTLSNQTYPPRKNTPLAAMENGDPQNNDMLSYLPGQRLSACTCPGQPHPGPMLPNGTFVGRSSPEIDIFEAAIDGGIGQVSQSAQWAPFNAQYQWANSTETLTIYNTTITALNTYVGGAYQQTTSGLTTTNQNCYELDAGCFSVYGFEYQPGFDNGYITWISDNTPAWTITAAGMGPDTQTEISARPISQEPMYIILNLGFSQNFGAIDFTDLTLPTTMQIDYVRVYQPSGAHNIGCDPPDYPTADYINTFIEAYTNPNLTSWGTPGPGSFNQTIPKNSLNGAC